MAHPPSTELWEQCNTINGGWIHVTDAIRRFAADVIEEAYDWFRNYKVDNPEIQKLLVKEGRHEYLQKNSLLAVMATIDNTFGRRCLKELEDLNRVKKEKLSKPATKKLVTWEDDPEWAPKPKGQKRKRDACPWPAGCDSEGLSDCGGFCLEHHLAQRERDEKSAEPKVCWVFRIPVSDLNPCLFSESRETSQDQSQSQGQTQDQACCSWSRWC
jgi:hypothetical protein